MEREDLEFNIDEMYLLWDGLRAVATRCSDHRHAVANLSTLRSARFKLNRLMYEAQSRELISGGGNGKLNQP
jgi:hypothetical protein